MMRNMVTKKVAKLEQHAGDGRDNFGNAKSLNRIKTKPTRQQLANAKQSAPNDELNGGVVGHEHERSETESVSSQSSLEKASESEAKSPLLGSQFTDCNQDESRERPPTVNIEVNLIAWSLFLVAFALRLFRLDSPRSIVYVCSSVSIAIHCFRSRLASTRSTMVASYPCTFAASSTSTRSHRSASS